MPTRPPIFQPVNVSHRQQDTKLKEAQRLAANAKRYDWTWRKVRAIKLGRDPMCELCFRDGFIREAKVVHHIIDIVDDPGKRLDLDNLQSLCVEHHNRISAKRQQDKKK